MSMPVLTYGCTACDLRVWDAQTWGNRYYLVKGQPYPMRISMGWCHACGTLAAVEKRPDTTTEQLLSAELQQLQAQLIALQPQAKEKAKRRWWFSGIAKTDQQRALESALEMVKGELQQLRELRALMTSRQEADRCLGCGSQACFHLPASPVTASFNYYNETPQLLGCDHPGCGGQLTVCSDGLRLSIKAASRAYDLRGSPIGPWSEL